jgi:hypothetical protein
VRPAERRIEHGDRRYRDEQDDACAALLADQLAGEERDGGERQAEEDDRRDPQGCEPRPPPLEEVLEPEMERPASALRRDDMEDVPERELGEPESQLFVDVQR